MRSVGVPTAKIALLSDQELVKLLKKGVRRAGDAIARRHNRLVAKAVYQVVKDLAAVEDVIQNAFLKAFRKIDLYDPAQGKFTVWLTTVSRNEAINYVRKRRRRRLVSIEETAPEGGLAPGDRPSQQVSKKETWRKIFHAIRKLPEPARMILTSRIMESQSFDKIAKRLKQPVDTVKTIYYRSTESLRKKMTIPEAPGKASGRKVGSKRPSHVSGGSVKSSRKRGLKR